MKATITLPGHEPQQVDATFEEIMRLSAEPGAQLFIPSCTCGSSRPCEQHPKTVPPAP